MAGSRVDRPDIGALLHEQHQHGETLVTSLGGKVERGLTRPVSSIQGVLRQRPDQQLNRLVARSTLLRQGNVDRSQLEQSIVPVRLRSPVEEVDHCLVDAKVHCGLKQGGVALLGVARVKINQVGVDKLSELRLEICPRPLPSSFTEGI